MSHPPDAITSTRHAIADVIRAALPAHYAVYPSPPFTLALPGVFLILGSGEPASLRGTYLADFKIVICSPAGDNDSSLATLESSLLTIIAALRAAYGNRPRWEDPSWSEPSRVTVGGQTALSVELLLTLPLLPLSAATRSEAS